MNVLNRLKCKDAWICGWFMFGVLGWLDFKTGYQISLVGFYFLNVAFLAWCCGRKSAVWASFIGALLWWSMDRLDGLHYPSEFVGGWNAFMRLVLFMVGGIACAELRKALNEKQQMIEDLQDALDKVKTLSGLLPNCPSCHRVRVENGAWEKLETYVQEKSHIEFISSICPECAEVVFAAEKNCVHKTN